MNRRPLGLFWLISKVEGSRMNAMTIDLPGGEKALPVFGFVDEARMFVDLGEQRGGWRARATTTEELVSVLLGPYADVSLVLLDPIPSLGVGVSASIVGVGREAFVKWLLDCRTPENALDDKFANPAVRVRNAPLLKGRKRFPSHGAANRPFS